MPSLRVALARTSHMELFLRCNSEAWKPMRKLPHLSVFLMLALANGTAWCQVPACNRQGTQVELTACAQSDFKMADAELNRVYKKRINSLTKSNQKTLREEQRAWLRNRDPKCNKDANAEAYGGSMWPMLYDRCREELTKDRTQQLRSWNGE